MSKSTIAGILTVIALLIGVGAYASMRDSDDAMKQGAGQEVMATPSAVVTPSGAQVTPTAVSTPVGTVTPSPTTAAGYSMTDVAAHI